MAGGETALRERRKAYQTDAVEGLAYLHPESALYGEYVDVAGRA
jgi:hypothetical protein